VRKSASWESESSNWKYCHTVIFIKKWSPRNQKANVSFLSLQGYFKTITTRPFMLLERIGWPLLLVRNGHTPTISWCEEAIVDKCVKNGTGSRYNRRVVKIAYSVNPGWCLDILRYVNWIGWYETWQHIRHFTTPPKYATSLAIKNLNFEPMCFEETRVYSSKPIFWTPTIDKVDVISWVAITLWLKSQYRVFRND